MGRARAAAVVIAAGTAVYDSRDDAGEVQRPHFSWTEFMAEGEVRPRHRRDEAQPALRPTLWKSACPRWSARCSTCARDSATRTI